MINISKSAQNHFVSLLSKEPKNTQIRIFITNPGMPHAKCGVAYCPTEEIEECDIRLDYTGFYAYVNKFILKYLKDAEIDLITDNLGVQLTFKAPYAKKNIISNYDSVDIDSISLKEKIADFLNQEINPQLALHGGQVNLVDISKQGIALIKFLGGCNGCSMIDITLKGIVEKKILSQFPEIKQVIDQTEHSHGHHSFY